MKLLLVLVVMVISFNSKGAITNIPSLRITLINSNWSGSNKFTKVEFANTNIYKYKDPWLLQLSYDGITWTTNGFKLGTLLTTWCSTTCTQYASGITFTTNFANLHDKTFFRLKYTTNYKEWQNY